MCGRAPLRTEGRIVVALLACLAGCASNPAPARWRPSLEQAAHTSLGSWVQLELTSKQEVGGELLEVSDDRVVLQDDRTVRDYPVAQVAVLRVYPFSQPWGYATGWGTVGTVSTLSHGAFLLLSAPLWIISTIATAAADSHIGQDTFGRGGEEPLSACRKYARFPQGLPAGYFERHLCPAPAGTACYARPAAPPPATVAPPGKP
jgi:hypothetical protein